MDARNEEMMTSLPPLIQQHVIYTFGPKEGTDVRDPNKYLGGVIGGIRKLAQSGLTEEESGRMIQLSKTGQRLSYKACTMYGQHGMCKYGMQCRYVHIRGIWE